MPTWGEMIAERINKSRDQKRSDAQETQTLRKLMSLYEPTRKDQFTTMGLEDLRGESLAFATKAKQAKELREQAKADREDQSAQALAALIGQTGGTTTTRMPNTTAPMFPDTVVQARKPISAARVRELLPNYPEAANSANLPDLLRILQTADSTEEAGGDPRILPGPFGSKLVTDARGRGTPQVVREEKSPEGYLDLPDEKDPLYGPRIRIPLSQARKEYPHLLKRLDGGGKESASEYKSAEDVKAALKAGKIKRDAAVEILRKQFGYQ